MNRFRWWRPETGFFLCMLVALLAAGRSQMFADPGCFWHQSTGDLVLREGFFHRDPFGFRAEHQDWFAKDWLSDVQFAVANRIGGPDTVLFVPVFFLSLFYTWIYHRTLRAGCHWMLGLVLVAGLLAVTSYHFFVRPLIFTLILMGVVFARLCDVDFGRRTIRSLWVVPPIIVLWTNLHPGVLGGIGTCGIAAVGWSLAWLLRLPSPVQSWRDVGELAAWAAVCCLAILINPFGYAYVKLSLDLVSSPLLPIMIDEHRRLSFLHPGSAEVGLLLFALLWTCFLAAMAPTKPRVVWGVAAVWFLLTIARVRNGELFAITAYLVIVEHLPRHPWTHWLARRGDLFVRPFDPLPVRPYTPITNYGVGLAGALVVLALQLTGTRVPVIGSGWANLDTKVSPADVLPTLLEYAANAPSEKPIFNDMNFGGYVIYFAPRLRVYIDDRCELWKDAGLREYEQLFHKPYLIERIADQYGIDLALVETDTPEKASIFDLYLAKHPDRWKPVKRGKYASIYRRE